MHFNIDTDSLDAVTVVPKALRLMVFIVNLDLLGILLSRQFSKYVGCFSAYLRTSDVGEKLAQIFPIIFDHPILQLESSLKAF
jgi:hypothetical protein